MPRFLPRQDCSGLFRPVAAVFPAKCPCFQPRQDCSCLFRPVAAVFSAKCPCFQPRQDCSGLFRPVVAVFPAKCPCFQPRQDCSGLFHPVAAVFPAKCPAFCRDRIVAACSVLSWPFFRRNVRAFCSYAMESCRDQTTANTGWKDMLLGNLKVTLHTNPCYKQPAVS